MRTEPTDRPERPDGFEGRAGGSVGHESDRTVHALGGVPEAHGDAMVELVRSWAPHRRWFPAKGSAVTLEVLGTVRLPRADAEVHVLLFRLPAGGVLQVPLVVRDPGGPLPQDEAAVVGTLPDGRVVVDGCHDHAFVEAWFAAATVPDGAVELDVAGMRVLSGEQSNTSVLLPAARPPGILKVFRGVASGPNPDVEVPLALSDTGWRGVPRPLAWLGASWPAAPGRARRDATPEGPPVAVDVDGGHLGVLSELVTGAEDGFERACRWAGDGRDFAGPARSLGATTAQMHRALRRALPVEDTAGPAARAERVLSTLRDRAAAAITAAPVLAERASRIDTVLSAVAAPEHLAQLPPLQRVHGDYHLGQVLHSEDRGWVVLDFEGEPQASAAERTRPDLALRDLAGMLRSVDYAAAVGGAGPDWARAAREALVAGYLAESEGSDEAPEDAATTALLRALELDKAVYEVVYETRNRPAWVQIPLDGVDRLLEAHAEG